MTKTFKKALALMVSVCLCCTAFMASLSVSATDPAALSVADATGAAGTDVSIPVTTANFEDNNIGGLLLEVNLGGLTFKSVSSDMIELVGGSLENPVNLYTVVDGVFKTTDAQDFIDGTLLTIIATIPDGAADGTTYDVTAAATQAATWDEADISIASGTATVTVPVSHVHTAGTEWFKDATNHWNVCTADDGEIMNQAAHTYDEGVVTTPATCTEDGVMTYTCTVCGYSYTEAIAATGEHSYDEGVVTTAPTCGDAGIKTYTCTVCGDTYTEAIDATGDHSYGELTYSVEDGNCITKHTCTECDAEEIVATVPSKAYTINPVVAAGLSIRFRILTSLTAGYTNVYGEFTKATYSSETMAYLGESSSVKIDSAIISNYYNQFEYTGIASYEMTCAITGNIFGTDANGNVVLISKISCTLADYLNEKIATASDNLKTFYADILTYGAAAQTHLVYRTDALATANLTAGLASDLPTTFTNTNTTKTGIDIAPTTVVGNSIMFRLRILCSAVTSYNLSNLKMTVSYTNASGVATTDTIDGSKFANLGNYYYQVEFANLPCAYITDYFTVKLLNGDTEIGTMDYSFQNFAAEKYNSTSAAATLKTLCQAIVAYSNSAKVAFGIK